MIWIWRLLLAVAVLSGLGALALAALPLLLVLLMLLFDATAHALMVLLGLIAGWLQALLPAGCGSALPPYQAISLHPLTVALMAALRSACCIAGLVVIVLSPQPGRHWGWVVLAWLAGAVLGGWAIAMILAPGLCAALALALRTKAGRA